MTNLSVGFYENGRHPDCTMAHAMEVDAVVTTVARDELHLVHTMPPFFFLFL